MVQQQLEFTPELVDKNAEGSRDLRPFCVDTFMQENGGDSNPTMKINCVVRWEDPSVEPNRKLIVVDVLQGPGAIADSFRRASELSAGRPRGQRCWTLPLS